MTENKTSRELRCEIQEWDLDEKKTKVLRFKDGELREGITVEGSEMKINFDKCYPDDVLAIMRDLLNSYTDKDLETLQAIKQLELCIQILDQRALRRHGYSYSVEEKNFKPTYLKE